MRTKNPNNIGAWTAIFIGLPFGAIFSWLVLYVSLFPRIDFGVAMIGGVIFWHPIIWACVIPLTFIFLLWKAGRKIRTHLDKNYSIIHTSFLFTLFVNSWLFGLILILFVIGGLFLNPLQTFGSSSISMTAILLTLLTYILSIVFTALTLGLIIVAITKKRTRHGNLG